MGVNAVFCLEHGGRNFIRNVSAHLPNYTVSEKTVQEEWPLRWWYVPAKRWYPMQRTGRHHIQKHCDLDSAVSAVRSSNLRLRK
jgi:hypothetical protein